MPQVRKVASLRRLFHFLLPPDSRLTRTAGATTAAAAAAAAASYSSAAGRWLTQR